MRSDTQKPPAENTNSPVKPDRKKILLPVVFILCVAFAIFSVAAQKNSGTKTSVKSGKNKAQAQHNGSKYRPASEPLVNDKNYSGNEFALVGIILEGASSRAIINNKTLRIGDKINNYTIKDIAAEKVFLINGRGQEKELKL